ncbi:TauD/TfdA family dioxygenase [Streptomyces sp. SLBN-115]|uniref:TauD/TfdA family dioxygenase n=1 Tax=Streptomyces sp. SLBN-115 TaxID=2768453 RepID=UPI001F338D5D|nr:TauD/TfdA family dioxygenase [Streptomyces sp. SLBN-115]
MAESYACLTCGGRTEFVAAALSDRLKISGYALLQLREPLSNSDFIAVGKALGKPITERDAAVQPYVEEGILLNLTTDARRTPDVSLQPFTTDFLTLHTEGSARPARRQPRHVLLMCCAPGNSGTARTVLVPMAMVRRRLSPGDAELLGRVRYHPGEAMPPLLRNARGQEVFSFRDFHTKPLEWVLDGDATEAVLVNPALRRLLVALYTSDGALAVEWRRGMLLAIDNHRFFHGRTVGDGRSPLKPRHLKRLRLLGRQ